MIVNDAQLAALEEIDPGAFEDYMAVHLVEFSPPHAQALGEPGLRALVREGVAKAARHGWTRRGPVKFHIELMLLLGFEFDADPQYPAVAAILQDPAGGDQVERADRIHAWVTDLIERVAGPDGSLTTRSLRRAVAMPFEPVAADSDGFEATMIERMRAIHPEKVAFVGEPALRALIARAGEEAARYDVATDAGVCLFVGLTFAMGRGVARDPKYPWVAGTLTNPAIVDRDRRVERLHSKAMTYLVHVLRNLERR